MAFSVSYHHLADRNIRNLYGGLPQDIRFRVMTSFPKSITATQRIKEQQTRMAPIDKFYQRRYYEYDTENNIRLPRAPAFRQLSRDRIDDMVNRLSKPTVSKRHRASDICERELKRYINETCPNCLVRAPSAPPTKYPMFSGNIDSARSFQGSRKDMDELTNRLLTPTVTSNIRNRMRCLHDWNVTEIHDACYKCAWTPSQRFYREMSIITL